MTATIIVVGAGQSGLATADAALRAGLQPIVLEASDRAAGSWPRYYDSLTLFSPARYSALAGRPFPGDPERYPTRDEVARYLSAYAASLDADIRLGHRVEQVEARGRGFAVRTTSGEELSTDHLVAATGGFGRPHLPTLPGRYDGRALHARDYRSPESFAGQRVVVVGGGNTGVQIAAELATVARVSLATRSPLAWMPQRPLGRDLHWWLTRSGLDGAPLGRWLRDRATPVVDDGRYRDAIAAGAPDQRPMFTAYTERGVRWPDGTDEPVDAIIFATGYRPDLAYLAGTGALTPIGTPLHRGGLSATVPGLGYVGLEYQRSIASATVRGVGRDARHVVSRLTAATQHARRQRPARRIASSCCRATA